MNKKQTRLTDEETSIYNILLPDTGASLNVAKAVKVLGESRATLYRKRKQGTGPAFVQDIENGTIRYPLHEIVRYLCNTKNKGVENADEK